MTRPATALKVVFAAFAAAVAAVLLIAGCGHRPAPDSHSDSHSSLPRAAVKDDSPPSGEPPPSARELSERDRRNMEERVVDFFKKNL